MFRCFLCAPVIGCLLAWMPSFAADVVAFHDVNVVPMTSETVLAHQTVVVRGDTIETVGAVDSVSIPEGATVVEGAGLYLIPGLSDMHIHLQGGRRYTPVMLEMYALTGVTTALCMRGSAGVLDARAKVAAGEWLGPRVFATSPIMGNASPDPKDYESGVAMAEEFVEDGYDFLKVYNQIPAEGYRGVMDAADRLGIPVIGHAVRSVGIDGAIARGQHIAHMEEFIYGYFHDDLDEAKIGPLAARMKEKDIAVVATLITYHNIIRQVLDIEKMFQQDGVDMMPEPLTRMWQPEMNDYVKRFTPEIVENRLQPNFEFQQTLLKGFHEAGIRVMTGTDSVIPIVVPGFSTHLELLEFVEAGLSPYEALAASTRVPAEFLGVGESSGTIEAGKRADLVLIEGNPLEDVAHTQRRTGVVVNGRWLDGAFIEGRLSALRAAAK